MKIPDGKIEVKRGEKKEKEKTKEKCQCNSGILNARMNYFHKK